MTSVARYTLYGVFALLVGLWLGGCERADEPHTLTGATMGTTWSVKVVGLPPGVPPEQLHSDIGLLLESVNHQMSTWDEDSLISRYNAAEADSWHRLPPDFFRVLDYALHLADETDGAYDPTVGPLVNLWGFGPGRDEFRVPSADEIRETATNTGWQRLELDPEDRAVLQPGGLYLDLSSVAKGFAVDKVSEFLAARGVESFLVEIGGELRGRGERPGGGPWRVAVEKPQSGGGRQVERVVPLRDMAMATSGDYRNFHQVDGKVYSHTIDPRTGYPVEHRLASVTVLAPDCMAADALATALTVLGPEEGLAFARERELPALFLVREDEGFSKRATAAFKALREEETQP